MLLRGSTNWSKNWGMSKNKRLGVLLLTKEFQAIKKSLKEDWRMSSMRYWVHFDLHQYHNFDALFSVLASPGNGRRKRDV